LLFSNFNISSIELPVAVWFHNTKEVTDYLFLPVNKFKRLPMPFALRQFINATALSAESFLYTEPSALKMVGL
jgi:hypothetical protein